MRIIKHGLKWIYGDFSYANTKCPECNAPFKELRFDILPFNESPAYQEAKPGFEVRYNCKKCGCQFIGKRLVMEKK
jgi:hypothetical protein